MLNFIPDVSNHPGRWGDFHSSFKVSCPSRPAHVVWLSDNPLQGDECFNNPSIGFEPHLHHKAHRASQPGQLGRDGALQPGRQLVREHHRAAETQVLQPSAGRHINSLPCSYSIATCSPSSISCLLDFVMLLPSEHIFSVSVYVCKQMDIMFKCFTSFRGILYFLQLISMSVRLQAGKNFPVCFLVFFFARGP